MARGINEKDVFTACDALLLAGERPTIERVRQKIGRGSPNTVSPMLDSWFKGLGRRLLDPGAFAPPPNIPGPVLQAAQHFWEVAQTGARADLEERVEERLKLMQTELDRARHAESLTQAERDTMAARIRGLSDDIAQSAAHLEAERVAHATTAAREQAGQDQLATLSERLTMLEGQLRETEERSRREGEAAQERATGAERRAAIEIEGERAARIRADKRSDALEKRLESLQATSTDQLAELVATRTSLDHERREADRLRQANQNEIQQRQAVDAALLDAKLAIGRAETEARTTEAAMTRLLPLIGEQKAKRAPTARRSPPKTK